MLRCGLPKFSLSDYEKIEQAETQLIFHHVHLAIEFTVPDVRLSCTLVNGR